MEIELAIIVLHGVMVLVSSVEVVLAINDLLGILVLVSSVEVVFTITVLLEMLVIVSCGGCSSIVCSSGDGNNCDFTGGCIGIKDSSGDGNNRVASLEFGLALRTLSEMVINITSLEI